MLRPTCSALAVLAALGGACDSGTVSPNPAPAVASVYPAAVAAALPAASPGAVALPHAPHSNTDTGWTSALDWHDYSSGLAEAKLNGKTIMLLIYADWCSKCRALAPVFERPDVRELASKFVVIRHDQDEPAPWLSALADGNGNYVPRVIFLNASGEPLKELTSGHPRYPFFYAADRPDALLASLKQALHI